ncbi:unnamed protein product [Cuscuta epithymum]|uniref:Uncharacterized protein n=1 Tax=Cuscuta epithymum TaxID=186058 RepID=A0AAV0DZ26_9ASTE|nr:unnamed protein product [Cuscuta epithymum]
MLVFLHTMFREIKYLIRKLQLCGQLVIFQHTECSLEGVLQVLRDVLFVSKKSHEFWLKNSRKQSYFDCHRKFLPLNHPYRKDKKSFIMDRIERDPPPLRLTRYQIYDCVQNIPFAIDDPLEYPDGYLTHHKWTMKSIFFGIAILEKYSHTLGIIWMYYILRKMFLITFLTH